MSDNRIKQDLISLLPIEKLKVTRPFSNITEYCLGDKSASEDFLAACGMHEKRALSDFERFREVWNEAVRRRESRFGSVLHQAVSELLGTDAHTLSPEEIWSLSADILDNLGADKLFSFDLDLLGVALSPGQRSDSLPLRLGKTELCPVACPLGLSRFDPLPSIRLKGYRDFESLWEGYDSVAIFAKAFVYREPNEYVAMKAYKKLSNAQSLSNTESEVLNSQLCRIVTHSCARKNKSLMIVLPTAPDVTSMGECARLLEYIDGTIREGRLFVTIFAPDAVGLCFAMSIAAREFKNITAVTGICGNGCGTPNDECAEYWGVKSLPIARASLASTPAFIGK